MGELILKKNLKQTLKKNMVLVIFFIKGTVHLNTENPV